MEFQKVKENLRGITLSSKPNNAKNDFMGGNFSIDR
jgi:hypothetical protein